MSKTPLWYHLRRTRGVLGCYRFYRTTVNDLAAPDLALRHTGLMEASGDQHWAGPLPRIRHEGSYAICTATGDQVERLHPPRSSEGQARERRFEMEVALLILLIGLYFGTYLQPVPVAHHEPRPRRRE